ncbi:hypothetical protein CYMTET_18159 [Cymbomonas tetramitiformis]|uniref:Reverse transcriptase domain-containing protein n=1 Tax=Cymbomonas tetramitiformis TaxID=36881 RepID=A0AAE0G8I7_9CHLO|nr:hypothetical protein CYMTET_18159 [Cymbomonas tetramitiformis]
MVGVLRKITGQSRQAPNKLHAIGRLQHHAQLSHSSSFWGTLLLESHINRDEECGAGALTAKADLQSAVEMLNFGLALGGFTPAVRDGRGKQSAPEYRTSDKRAREDNDENEEEEQADDAVFEEVEEIATVPPVNKKDPISGEMKSVAVPRLPKDQFLAQNMKMVERFEDETEREHFLNYISWIAEPTEFFRVENYVPPEHEEKVALKLQEEEDAGRMVRTDAWSVPGISALGIVLRVVDGKVKERIVHDLSRPVGLSVNDNCVIDKRRFQSVETAFGLMQPYSYMAKIDLKSAYRFVWIAAPLFRFLASEFKDVLRIDTGFPFGAKAAPGLFSDITQLVRLMMQQRGFPGIVVYLDDFILVADTEEACQQGFEILIELVEYLGFEVGPGEESGLGLSGDGCIADGESEGGGETGGTVDVLCTGGVWGKDVLRSGYDFIGRAGRMRRFYDKVPGDLSRDLLWLAKMLEVYNGQAVVLNRRPVVRDFFAVDAAGEEAVDGGMGGFFAG